VLSACSPEFPHVVTVHSPLNGLPRPAIQVRPVFNPGWNLATDLPAMLAVSNLVTTGALGRCESRGGHTRDDYPAPATDLGRVNLVQRLDDDGDHACTPEPRAELPGDLAVLLAEETD
jgi:succinate dehydrogenase / fumarate reductase flavoprotein subunit